MIARGFRYKLAPTSGQAALFRHFAGVCRLVYNLGLEQRRDHWRAYYRLHNKHIGYVAQARELTALRAQYEWIAAVSQTCQQQVLRDLDRAYANFFKGIAGYPTPRRKGVNDAFRFQGRELEIKPLCKKWAAVRLPKIGWVKFRDTRPMRGVIKNATVSLDALGWHIAFACEIEHVAPDNNLPAIGIDRGVVNTLMLSNGTGIAVPSGLETIERRHRAAQRKLARRRRGSNRRRKQLRCVARLAALRARVRRDWLHRVSTDIARSFGVVILEDLRIRSMTASAKGTLYAPGRNVRQKSGLNRSILNQGWHAFEVLLAYKLEERGGTLLKINPAHTSQTCSACGAADAGSRKNQATFECIACGFALNADHNAAINIRDAGLGVDFNARGIRRWNTSSLRVEDGPKAADEARTTQGEVSQLGNPSAAAGGRC